MSADTLGVSRQGYSELETDVLHYLQGLGRDIAPTGASTTQATSG